MQTGRKRRASRSTFSPPPENLVPETTWLTYIPYSGFQFELREVPKDDLEEHILAANTDDAVDGIIVYFPVFGNRQVPSSSSPPPLTPCL